MMLENVVSVGPGCGTSQLWILCTMCKCSYLVTCFRERCLNYASKFVLIADWSVAHFIVIMNDVMNDNMAAFAHVVRSFIGPDV